MSGFRGRDLQVPAPSVGADLVLLGNVGIPYGVLIAGAGIRDPGTGWLAAELTSLQGPLRRGRRVEEPAIGATRQELAAGACGRRVTWAWMSPSWTSRGMAVCGGAVTSCWRSPRWR